MIKPSKNGKIYWVGKDPKNPFPYKVENGEIKCLCAPIGREEDIKELQEYLNQN